MIRRDAVELDDDDRRLKVLTDIVNQTLMVINLDLDALALGVDEVQRLHVNYVVPRTSNAINYAVVVDPFETTIVSHASGLNVRTRLRWVFAVDEPTKPTDEDENLAVRWLTIVMLGVNK